MNTTGTKPLGVAVVGLGQMGISHSLAYHNNPGYHIIALVTQHAASLPQELQSYPTLKTLNEALKLQPDVVSINTHSNTHAEHAIAALEAGAHVFVEKPLATTVADAQRVVDTARRKQRKLLVGYILRHHPSWIEFVRRAQMLGGPPFVMRMNLNQQSRGAAWEIHKRILEHTSPVVDCGVHYVDVMLQITQSRPVQVRGMGVRLNAEISEGQTDYGHLQVLFDDGSVGWYEAGWGPAMSETAFFVKDVIGPRGSVSIIGEEGEGGGSSANVDLHTKTARIRVHRAEGGEDDILPMADEPDHVALCGREQQYLLEAIQSDADLEEHMENAVRSLAIVLAADESMRKNAAVDL